jgi:hypothetical protein
MTETDTSEGQAVAQLAGIREMVAALECDYDRFAELREQRDTYDPEDDEPLTWADTYADEAEELAGLEKAAGECESQDDARERIEQDPLSVRVRSDWHSPGEDPTDACGEFEILLCTGGPACRIVGELAEPCEPCRIRIEHQDWFTPWTDYPLNREEEEVVLTYCRCFYFRS